MADSQARASPLLERERELATLERMVDAACAGQGGAVVVEAPAGLGKTTLVAWTRALAAQRGMRVVSAGGSELEQGFPYGVVRQFFESFLFTVAPEERMKWLRGTAEMAGRMFAPRPAERREPAEEFALLHSLYWMCVNIADEQPLLMVLDDAQWADAPSLAFAGFAGRRLEQLPFMLVVASRPPDERTPAPLVSLLAEPPGAVLRPSPLSEAAVLRLVRERVDPAADPAFAAACHEATGGNPFLVHELLLEVADQGLAPTAESAARVREIGPPGVARVVLLRLRRLPDAARRLLAALSVANTGVMLPELAELARVSELDAVLAASALETAEIVELRDGVRFVHPILRTTVYEDLTAVERRELHWRAARLHTERDRPVAEVAHHLREVEPGGDPWVVATLREAAREAWEAGDFAAAEDLLARAHREGIEGPEAADLLAELGRAEVRTGNPAGLEHLEAAVRALDDPARRAAVAIELTTLLNFSSQADRSVTVLLDALDRLDGESEPITREVQSALLGARFISPEHAARLRDRTPALAVPDGPPRDFLDAFVIAAAAFDAVAGLRPAAEAIELGRRALSGRGLPADPVRGGQTLILATSALMYAEDFAYVLQCHTRTLADARAGSSPLAVGNASTLRARCAYRCGRLLEAEADAATALDLAGEVPGLRTFLPLATAYAVVCGIERGARLDALHALAFDDGLDAGPQLLLYTQLSWARGELCLAREEWDRALVHFEDCDRPDPSFGGANPAMLPWREGAALAALRLGDEDRARALAADALERAQRFGAPRALGIALRATALTARGAERLDGLRTARAVLAEAGSPLELARVGCELGAAERAAGRRTDAQAVLEQAHELATSIGAVRIADRAAEELGAAGVRPRREPATGLAALTRSERRVAQMAADGKTNREIAQALFVTEKTVETHLGHVYDKLGVRSRRRLPDVLAPPPASGLSGPVAAG